MLDRAQLRAIARIALVDADGSETPRGTGALVTGDGLVLTAAHAVADRRRDPVVPLGHAWRLEFGIPGKTAVHRTDATIVRVARPGEHDWALLRCATPPPEAPLRLHPLDGEAPFARWEMFGWSTELAPDGGFYAGAVRARHDDLALLCEEIRGRRDADVTGLSGGPCFLLDTGAVIGVIRAEPRVARDKVFINVGATLLATPVERVVEECGGLLALDTQPLPYEDVFATKLEDLRRPALESLAERLLRLPRPYRDDLARRCARALIQGGLFTVVDALKTLGSSIAAHEDLLRSLAETLWVPGRAAGQLAGLLDRPHYARAAAVNSKDRQTARDYLCRACAHRHGNEPYWHREAIEVPNVHGGEWQGAGLLDAIRDALADQYGWSDDDAIRAGVRNVQTFIVVQEPTPRAHVLAAVEKQFPGIHLLLLTDAAIAEPIRTATPSIDWLAPDLEPGQEDVAKRQRRAALERLRPRKKVS
jgi:hypothetical protein